MANKKIDYFMPTEITFGHGAIAELKNIAGRKKRILLITGRTFLKKTGWLSKIQGLLKSRKIEIFDGVYENPDIALIEAGIKAAKSFKPDLIIGIGGGSVLDSAKAIALLAGNKGSVISFLDKKAKIVKRGISVAAVPTTAGSSSEITPYSVITVKERGIKITLAHEYLYPSFAVIDPDILSSLSKGQIANSGIDALCHSIESYWNVNNNPVSDMFALESIRLIFRSLKSFFRSPSSKKAAFDMAAASMFAGLAFSNTRTTACHSISYPLTTVFGIPHGQACAATLPGVLTYNASVIPERMMNICQAIGAKNPKDASARIKRLMKDIGLKTGLKALGLNRKDLETVLDKGFTPERMVNNPKKITRADMAKILARCF